MRPVAAQGRCSIEPARQLPYSPAFAQRNQAASIGRAQRGASTRAHCTCSAPAPPTSSSASLFSPEEASYANLVHKEEATPADVGQQEDHGHEHNYVRIPKQTLAKLFSGTQGSLLRTPGVSVSPAEHVSRRKEPNVVLTAQIMSCSTWQEAYALFVEFSDVFNSINTAALVTHISKLIHNTNRCMQHSPTAAGQEWMEALLELRDFSEGEIPNYEPQGLANTACAFANLGLLSKRYAQLVIARSEPSEFSNKELTQLLWSFGTSGFRPDARWLRACFSELAVRRGALTHRELCSSLWALAKLGLDPGPGWTSIVSHELVSRAPTLTEPDLANVLWSLATLHHQPPRPLLAALLVASAGLAPSMSPKSLCTILWAASVGGWPVPPSWVHTLSQALHRHCSRAPGVDGLSASDAAMALHALGRLKFQPPVEVTSRLSSVVVSQMGRDMATSDLVSWCCGLAGLGYKPSRRSLACFFLACIKKRRLTKCPPRQLTAVLCGLAKLGSVPPPIFTASVCMQLMRRAHEWTPRELANTMWALATFRRKLPLGLLSRMMWALLEQQPPSPHTVPLPLQDQALAQEQLPPLPPAAPTVRGPAVPLQKTEHQVAASSRNQPRQQQQQPPQQQHQQQQQQQQQQQEHQHQAALRPLHSLGVLRQLQHQQHQQHQPPASPPAAGQNRPLLHRYAWSHLPPSLMLHPPPPVTHLTVPAAPPPSPHVATWTAKHGMEEQARTAGGAHANRGEDAVPGRAVGVSGGSVRSSASSCETTGVQRGSGSLIRSRSSSSGSSSGGKDSWEGRCKPQHVANALWSLVWLLPRGQRFHFGNTNRPLLHAIERAWMDPYFKAACLQQGTRGLALEAELAAGEAPGSTVASYPAPPSGSAAGQPQVVAPGGSGLEATRARQQQEGAAGRVHPAGPGLLQGDLVEGGAPLALAVEQQTENTAGLALPATQRRGPAHSSNQTSRRHATSAAHTLTSDGAVHDPEAAVAAACHDGPAAFLPAAAAAAARPATGRMQGASSAHHNRLPPFPTYAVDHNAAAEELSRSMALPPAELVQTAQAFAALGYRPSPAWLHLHQWAAARQWPALCHAQRKRLVRCYHSLRQGPAHGTDIGLAAVGAEDVAGAACALCTDAAGISGDQGRLRAQPAAQGAEGKG